MISKIHTISFSGIDVIDIEVQVHFAKGQPGLTIVGLGDKAIAESRDRIRAALSSMGLILPANRITINLAPADVIKEGSHFDLPIAIGILASMDIIKQNDINNYIVIGELSLDGSIRHVSGVLPAAMHANVTKKGIICPIDNGQEAAWAGEDVEIIAAANLLSLINHLKGSQIVSRPKITKEQLMNNSGKDISEVKGQEEAKFALEIAASGAHNMLMVGPPGTGKSMLASRINTILPPLDPQEMLDVSMIHSIAGLIKNGVLSSIRPFRSPHHSASMPSIVGGGRFAKPGEITLAHNGVLFLDELAEYPRYILDSLRQPIETGDISISRIHSRITYPANFQLIAAMNPCHCGYYGDPNKQCNKIPNCVMQYQGKISGPLMDRIDICIRMNNSDYKFNYDGELISQDKKDHKNESSAIIKQRVIRTRNIQKERYKNYKITTNSQADGDILKIFCMPKKQDAIDTLNDITSKLQVSMRGITKILRVARTIADMYEKEEISKEHILQAALFRNKNLF